MKKGGTVRYCVVCGSPLPSEKVFIHDGCRGTPKHCAECGQVISRCGQSASIDATKSLYCARHRSGHRTGFNRAKYDTR